MQLETTMQVTIGGTPYKVSYPNVRQKLEIETLKAFLTNNKYGELARSGHKAAAEVLDIVDAVSTFIVLIPEIRTSMEVQDFDNMDAIVQRNFVKAYSNQYWPWYTEIENELNKEDENDDTNSQQEHEASAE